MKTAKYEATLLEYIQFKLSRLRGRGLSPKYIVLTESDWQDIQTNLSPLSQLFPDEKITENRLFGLSVVITGGTHDPIVGV